MFHILVTVDRPGYTCGILPTETRQLFRCRDGVPLNLERPRSIVHLGGVNTVTHGLDVVAATFRIALFSLAVVAAAIAAVDWLVRTRRISPFSATARYFRRTIDPIMAPVERTVVRAGGQPAAAPWWTLVAVIVGGLGLLLLLDVLRGLLQQLLFALSEPRVLPVLLVSWTFKVLKLALIVRVISSWLPVSPYSRWIRWSFTLTDWCVLPLRRILPPFGMFDLSPLIAYVLLAWVLEPLLVGGMQRIMGA